MSEPEHETIRVVATVSSSTVAELPLDPTCPWCNRPHDIAEAFAGYLERCRQCRRPIVGVDCGVTMEMYRYVDDVPAPLTGRQRTRARWRKQGRR